MQKFTFSLIAAVAALFSTSNADAGFGPRSSGLAGSMVFQDAQYRFAVEVPDTWDIQEGYAEQNLDFVMIAMSPEEGPRDRFIENMNILVDSIGHPMSSKDYFNQNLRGVMQDLPNIELREQSQVTVNGVPMHKAVYTWSGDASRITTYQFIFVRADKGYVITFTTEPGSFQRFRPVFDDIVKSFAFNP